MIDTKKIRERLTRMGMHAGEPVEPLLDEIDTLRAQLAEATAARSSANADYNALANHIFAAWPAEVGQWQTPTGCVDALLVHARATKIRAEQAEAALAEAHAQVAALRAAASAAVEPYSLHLGNKKSKGCTCSKCMLEHALANTEAVAARYYSEEEVKALAHEVFSDVATVEREARFMAALKTKRGAR